MTNTSRTALALVVAPSLLVGCGDDGETTPATTIDDRPAPVVVVADEYSYRPTTVTARRPLRVRLDNAGTLAHTWTVIDEPIEVETDLTAEAVLAEVRVEPGQSAIADLAELAPGRYQVVCAIAGHISAGMVGEVVIEP